MDRTGQPPRSTRLAIVGAGPHGLALAVHLAACGRAGEDELVVLDPSGRWLDTWRRYFRSFDLPALRSPGVHHPGTDATALGAWAQLQERRSTVAYAQPHADVFESYYDHLIQEHGLEERVEPRRVTMLGTCGRVATLLLDDDSLLDADRVVLATNPGRRRIPPWVLDLRPIPPGVLAHSGEVDLSDVCVAGQEVAVVGGSVPNGIANRLSALRDAGRLLLREETRVVSGRTVDHRSELVLSDETRLRPDRIWLATATEPCVEACTLLDDLRRSHPCDVHHGFPDLDADLSWLGMPIHLSGRLASLRLGPAAGNLWGACKAAERIAAAFDARSRATSTPAGTTQ